MLALREKKVGPYTVRELPMRETLRVLRELGPDADAETRGAVVLGASVFNGSGQAVGAAVLDLGSGVYRALMAAHTEVNANPFADLPVPPQADEGAAAGDEPVGNP